MTPNAALCELLARLGASQGAEVLISEEELNTWPSEALKAMKLQKLLVRARPAVGVVCPGCEQECVMPVHTLTHDKRGLASFIVCDKRDDINRVPVPISRLEQWQSSSTSLANLIAGLLGLRRPDIGDTSVRRWEIGMLKGARFSSHVVLLADGRLTLTLAGHSIGLGDILAFESDGFRLDKKKLAHLVDKPIAGSGDVESSTQRRVRLKKWVQAEKDKGNRAFLKTVAMAESLSVTRLKQLLHPKSKPKPKFRRSAY
jgi:hypothetical protein